MANAPGSMMTTSASPSPFTSPAPATEAPSWAPGRPSSRPEADVGRSGADPPHPPSSTAAAISPARQAGARAWRPRRMYPPAAAGTQSLATMPSAANRHHPRWTEVGGARLAVVRPHQRVAREREVADGARGAGIEHAVGVVGRHGYEPRG